MFGDGKILPMSMVREVLSMLIYHGVRSSVLIGVGLVLGTLLGFGLVFVLHRAWYRVTTLADDVRPQPPVQLTSMKLARGLCWVFWLVTLPALLGLAGASVGGAFALRGLLEDPRPLERGVDLAMVGSRLALESALNSRPAGVGTGELEMALGFVDGSDRFDIETVPKRLEAFSDEAVVRSLAEVDEVLLADDEPDPVTRWLASGVIDRMVRWPVAAAGGHFLDPVLEQLRERDSRTVRDGRTTGPDVVLAISRHYGQRPIAAGLFWSLMLEAVIVIACAGMVVLGPMSLLLLVGRAAG